MLADYTSGYSLKQDVQEVGIPPQNAVQKPGCQDDDDTASVCSSIVDKICNTCQQPAVNRCKGCKVTYYCSTSCQRSDWPTHRVLCRKRTPFEEKFEVSVNPEAFLKEKAEKALEAERQSKPHRHTKPTGGRGKSSASDDGHSGTDQSSRTPQTGGASSQAEKWVSSKDRPGKDNSRRGNRQKDGVSSSDSERDRNRRGNQPRSNIGNQSSSQSGNQSSASLGGSGDATSQETAKDKSDQFRGRIKVTDVAQDTLDTSEPKQVWVTHFENPGKFYLCKKESLQAAFDMGTQLKEVYDNTPCKGYTPEKKELVAAKFRADGSWYRARVDTIDLDGTIRVTFVDYGNSDEVSVSEIRKLQPEFTKIPIQGMLCSLDAAPSGSQWCTESKELCETELLPVMSSADITARLLKVVGEKLFVEVKDESMGTNAAQVLISKGLAKKVETPTEASGGANSETVAKPKLVAPPNTSSHQSEPTTSTPQSFGPPPIQPLPMPTAAKGLNPGDHIQLQVVEVVSPSQVYIQVPSEDLQLLDTLGQALTEHYNRLTPKKGFRITADRLYACKFTSDGMWYRAWAYDYTPSQVMVQYLDFANYEAVPLSNLHPLEGNFRSLQFQAVCCNLYGIEAADGETWAPEATKYLASLVANQTLRGLVYFKDDCQIHIEIANDQKQSINDLLIQKGYARQKAKPMETASLSPKSQIETQPLSQLSDLPQADLGAEKEFPAQVTHSTGPHDLVLQIMEPSHPMLLQCVELIRKLSEVTPEPYRPVAEGELVCALFQEDQSWYRAVVTKMFPDKAKVCFIDYGNSEEVQLSDICKLPTDLLKYPCFGLHCSLHDIRGMAPGKKWDPMILQPLSKNWLLQIKSGDMSSGLKVDILDSINGKSFTQELLDEGMVERGTSQVSQPSLASNASASSHQESSSAEISHNSFRQEVSRVGMMYFVGPHEMYLCCLDDKETVKKYDELQKRICLYYSEGEEEYKPKRGELVAAFSQDFSEWYRAEVTTVKPDTAVVNCVDYGNDIECHFEHIRRLKTEFVSLPRQVVKCSLFGLEENQVKWSRKAKERLQNLTSAEILRVKVEGTRGQTAIITELYQDKNNVDLLKLLTEEKLIKPEDLGQMNKPSSTRPNRVSPKSNKKVSTPQKTSINAAKKSHLSPRSNHVNSGQQVSQSSIAMSSSVSQQEIPQNKTISVVVVHADSMDSFYIQPQVDRVHEKFQRMSQEINGQASSSQAHSPTKGELVLAKFESEWFRAEILAIKPDGQQVRVFFVDYGNRAQLNVSEVRKLDAKYTELPKQAVRCCLSGIRGNQGSDHSWSKDAEKFFQKHILNQKVGLLFSGEKGGNGQLMVDLILQGDQSVAEVMVEKSLAEAKPAADKPTQATGGSSSAHKPAPKVVKQQQTSRSPNPPPAQRVVPSPGAGTFRAKDLGVISMPPGKCAVMVTDVVSVHQFTVTVIDIGELEKLTVMNEEMFTYCQNIPADLSLNLSPGDLCCALFAVDGQWYRADVIDKLSPTQLKVRFIDYGNEETQDLANIRPFKQEFMSVKAQGLTCALKGISQSAVIPDPVNQEFSALVKEKRFDCQQVQQRFGVNVVNLCNHDAEPVIDINQTIQNLLKENDTTDENDEFDKKVMAAVLKAMEKITAQKS